MKSHTWIILAASVAALVAFCEPAEATAYADTNGGWGVDLNYQYTEPGDPFPIVLPDPSGVTVSCFGSGLDDNFSTVDFGHPDCGDYESLTVTNFDDGNVSKSLDTSGAFIITNTTDQVLIGIFAFNVDAAGDFPVGGFDVTYASVTNTNESAGYSTFITPPLGTIDSGDEHSCSTTLPSSPCVIDSTDDNPGQLYLTLGPDESLTETFNIALSVGTASPIPEPATLALFGAGLLCLGFSRRRRNVKREQL